MRKEYEMTPEQLQRMLDACKPTPVMYLTGGQPMFKSPQENANAAWKQLGDELGFDYGTVEPVPGKSQQFFSAEEKSHDPQE